MDGGQSGVREAGRWWMEVGLGLGTLVLCYGGWSDCQRWEEERKAGRLAGPSVVDTMG